MFFYHDHREFACFSSIYLDSDDDMIMIITHLWCVCVCVSLCQRAAKCCSSWTGGFESLSRRTVSLRDNSSLSTNTWTLCCQSAVSSGVLCPKAKRRVKSVKKSECLASYYWEVKLWFQWCHNHLPHQRYSCFATITFLSLHCHHHLLRHCHQSPSPWRNLALHQPPTHLTTITLMLPSSLYLSFSFSLSFSLFTISMCFDCRPKLELLMLLVVVAPVSAGLWAVVCPRLICRLHLKVSRSPTHNLSWSSSINSLQPYSSSNEFVSPQDSVDPWPVLVAQRRTWWCPVVVSLNCIVHHNTLNYTYTHTHEPLSVTISFARIVVTLYQRILLPYAPPSPT